MASFDEVQFPVSIALNAAGARGGGGSGLIGGPGFSTDVIVLSSGYEQRNQNWAAARGAWDVASGIKTDAQMQAFLDFFYARAGRARGFRFKDWKDFSAIGMAIGSGVKKTASDITIASSDKSYTTAGAVSFAALAPDDSIIVANADDAGNNGTKTVVTASATKITVAQACTSHASGTAITIGKIGPYQLIKLYTSGGVTYTRTIKKPVAGSITLYAASVAAPGTVDSTTGIATFTAAPADAAALTADFQFDVPVRFDIDKLDIAIEDMQDAAQFLSVIGKIPIVELRV